MYPTEAYPLMARLEEEGIESFLADENTVSVQPFLSNAVGGVKVNIKEIDSKKALLILKELNRDNKKEEKKLEDKWNKDFERVEAYCPECESANIYQEKLPLYKTILTAFQAKQNYCADCGHIWK